MLSQLYIENVAVIEKCGIDFDSGFNVLTGETGAGKSILIDAIGAVLGERTSREIIRSGAESAMVSAAFCGIGKPVLEKLGELGYRPDEDGNLLLQREISAEGRASCRVNGRPAPVSVLKELGSLLVNIHGQHESYQLLSPDLHIHYIDRMGELEPLAGQYRAAYDEMRRMKSELRGYDMDEAQKARRMDLLKYQIEELEAANLRAGEQEELTRQQAMYRNSEKIAASLNGARELLDGEEGGALSSVGGIARYLSEAQRYLPSLEPLAQRFQNMEYDLEDCGAELRDLSSRLEYDPGELARIESRLDVIYRLSLKYGETVEQMLEYLDRCAEELKNIELSDENINRLTERYEAAKAEAVRLAKELSRRRAETSKAFAARVRDELKFLDMPGVDFQVEQERCPLNNMGCDKIQFLLSTNPGEPAKPIAKIASGGELSRIMLAVKTVLAGKDEIDTLIFDEVDTGISGSAAQKVGFKLREVSKNRQVICVTHLAQIAALGDSHMLIKKHVEKNRTHTDVTALDFEGRKRELARIMGGTQITGLMLESAEEMLGTAGISKT